VPRQSRLVPLGRSGCRPPSDRSIPIVQELYLDTAEGIGKEAHIVELLATAVYGHDPALRQQAQCATCSVAWQIRFSKTMPRAVEMLKTWSKVVLDIEEETNTVLWFVLATPRPLRPGRAGETPVAAPLGAGPAAQPATWRYASPPVMRPAPPNRLRHASMVRSRYCTATASWRMLLPCQSGCVQAGASHDAMGVEPADVPGGTHDQ
jgi:hypothetical protein